MIAWKTITLTPATLPSANILRPSFKTLGPHKYGCLMAVLPDGSLRKTITDWCLEKIPDYHLTSEGRELRPHITVKYGFKDSSPREIQRLRNFLGSVGPFSVVLSGASFFKGGEDGDVLKIDVGGSGLIHLNQAITENFPCHDKYPEYKPHLTLAYLRPEVVPLYEGISPPFIGEMVIFDSLEFTNPEGEGETIRLGLGGKTLSWLNSSLGGSLVKPPKQAKKPIKFQRSRLCFFDGVKSNRPLKPPSTGSSYFSTCDRIPAGNPCAGACEGVCEGDAPKGKGPSDKTKAKYDHLPDADLRRQLKKRGMDLMKLKDRSRSGMLTALEILDDMDAAKAEQEQSQGKQKYPGADGTGADKPPVEEKPSRLKNVLPDVGKIVSHNTSASDVERMSNDLAGVIEGMPPNVQEILRKNVKKVWFFGSLGEMNDELYWTSKKAREHIDQGGQIGGMWRDSEGTLYLDSPHDTTGVYAHELGHSIDKGLILSNDSAWNKAWQEEIVFNGDVNNPRLTKYAMSESYEGFAEFSRLVYGYGLDPSTVEASFPQCSAFWKEKGLWPEAKPTQEAPPKEEGASPKEEPPKQEQAPPKEEAAKEEAPKKPTASDYWKDRRERESRGQDLNTRSRTYGSFKQPKTKPESKKPSRDREAEISESEAEARVDKADWEKMSPKARKVAGGIEKEAKQVKQESAKDLGKASRTAARVARERGLSQSNVPSIGRILSLIDAALRGGSRRGSFGSPYASFGYIAHSNSSNPYATIRAARSAVRDAGVEGEVGQGGYDDDSVAELNKALEEKGNDDWFSALVHAALDFVGGSLKRALEVAEKVYRKTGLQ